VGLVASPPGASHPLSHRSDVRDLKRSGERTQVRFVPGCLVWSIALSIALTSLVNVLIRLF